MANIVQLYPKITAITLKIQNCELQHLHTTSLEGVGVKNALEDGTHRNGGAVVLLSAPLLLLSLLPAHLSQPPLHIEVPLENYL